MQKPFSFAKKGVLDCQNIYHQILIANICFLAIVKVDFGSLERNFVSYLMLQIAAIRYDSRKFTMFLLQMCVFIQPPVHN